ncbi:MAG: hypothetical protein R3B96_19535 [Pirellulaceae bacterium]
MAAVMGGNRHHDVIADLPGILATEGGTGAMSTMTAIIGRMATYSGVELTMEQALASELTLCDVDSLKTLEDAAPLLNDNGDYYVAVPGVRKDFGMIFEIGNSPEPLGEDREILDWASGVVRPSHGGQQCDVAAGPRLFRAVDLRPTDAIRAQAKGDWGAKSRITVR